MKISATVITLNEGKNIRDCLASLDFVDEIIVVDSGSKDHTAEICRSFSRVKFYEHSWEGFGRQKNIAAALATNDWILNVDADERATIELAHEIGEVLKFPACDGYFVKRKNFYKGQWVRHSGWWPDRVLRLYRKKSGRFSNRLVHEKVEIGGKIGSLIHALEHYSFRSMGDFLKQANEYSSLGARVMYENGRDSSVFLAFLHSIFAFLKGYILQRGFLDGRAGVLIAVSNAVGVFYRYMKVLELENEKHD